jgi:hypothetical protein
MEKVKLDEAAEFEQIDLTKEVVYFDEFNRARRRVLGIEKMKRKRKKHRRGVGGWFEYGEFGVGDVVTTDYFTQVEFLAARKDDATGGGTNLRTCVSHMNLKSRGCGAGLPGGCQGGAGSHARPRNNVKIEAVERDRNFKIAIHERNNNEKLSHLCKKLESSRRMVKETSEKNQLVNPQQQQQPPPPQQTVVANLSSAENGIVSASQNTNG